ncbi:MAG: hypothetical protein J6Y02_08410 [Pseudobutyrivibrio sp.]|nr:hypothetical protein [Pseudobutyrivibrio sp.]
MADVIDEKVVSMQFDNKEFEKNVAESLKSIQELKKSLDFDSSTKNLEGLAQASKKFSFAGISGAIDEVKQGFSAMEIAGVTAFANLVNSAVNAGKRMVSALTIDPVKQGFGVYESKMNTVMTIMNNSGKSLQETMEILNELNEYSDKTIYSLNDMTNALGKFTAQGVDARKAVDIIKGAANEAATMGAGSEQFSRMIYNLTQAFGMGKMLTIDWRSLENANVAGAKFKQTLIDSYEELAKMGKVTDKFVGKVTIKNLRDMLREGIITSEVMEDAFMKYAGMKQGFEDFGQAAENAAKQVKTFHQLLDVLKESVASQWSHAWGYIVGDFNEAKRLWSVVNVLFDQTVGAMVKNRVELLRLWHDGFTDPETGKQISGRILLLQGLTNILLTIRQITKPIKEAFRELFPAKTAENLWAATKSFRDFTARLRLSEGAMKQIKDAAGGFFAILKFIRTAIKDVLAAIFPATKGVDSLLSVILGLAGALGRAVKSFLTTIQTSEAYRSTINAIGKAAIVLIKILNIVVQTVYKLGKTAKDIGVFQKIFSLLTKAVLGLINVVMKYGPKVLDIVSGIAQVLFSVAGLIFSGIGAGVNFFKNLFSRKDGKDAAEAVSEVTKSVQKLSSGQVTESGENLTKGFGVGILAGMAGLLQIVGKAFGSVITFVEKIFRVESPSKVFIAIGAFCLAGFLIGITNSGILSQIGKAIADFANNSVIGGFVNAFKKGLGFISNVWMGIIGWITNLARGASEALQGVQVDEMGVAVSTDSLATKLGNLMGKLVGMFKNVNAAALLLSGVVVGSVLAILKALKIVVNITHFFDEVGGGFYRLTSSFNNMAKAFKRQQSPLVRTLQGIALAIISVAASLFILSTLKETDQLGGALIALIGSLVVIMTVMVSAAALISKFDLGNAVKTLTGSIISVAASFLILTVAFTTLIQTLQTLNGQYEYVIVALGGLIAIGVIMFEFSRRMSMLDMTKTLKSVLSMLVLANVIRVLCNSVKKLAGVGDPGLIAVAGGILAGLMAMLAGLAYSLQGVKISSSLLLIALTITLKSVIKIISSIDWDKAIQKMSQYSEWIVGVLIVAGLISYGAHLLGQGVKAFGIGIAGMASAVLMLAGALAIIKASGTSLTELGTLAGLLLEVAGLAAIMMAITKYVNPPKKDMQNLIKLLHAVGTLVIMIGVSTAIMTKTGATPGMVWSIGGVLIAFAGMLTVLMLTMKNAKKTKFAELAKVVRSFSIVILSLGLLAKMFKDVNGKDMGWMIGSLITVFLGIAALCYMAISLDESAVKPMRTVVSALLVITGSLVLLSMVPYDDMIKAMAGLTVTLLSVFLIVSAMGRLNKEALGPAVVAVVMILSVAASLVVLAKICDWQATLAAAGAMSATLLAVAIGLRIIAGANVASIIAAAASITIAAAGLFVLAFALKQFTELDLHFDEQLGVIAASFGVLVAALLLLGAVGPMVLAAAGAILIGSVGLIALAHALQEFQKIDTDYGKLLKTAGVLAVLGIAGVVFGAGSLGLIAGSAGLLILSLALINMSKANVESGYLYDLAGSLALLGLSGIVFGLGSAGLAAGGIGLIVLAGGLALISKLDFKVLSKKNLQSLAAGLRSLALAGIIGVIGGPGLIALAAGFTALAGSVMLVATALDVLFGIMSVFTGDAAESMGENTIDGYQNGVAKKAPTMLSVVGKVFTGLISGICDILGIHSPSEVLRKIGEFTGWGFLEGWANSKFVQKLDEVSAAIAQNGVVKPFAETLANGFGNIGDVFNGLDLFGNQNKEIEAQIEKEELLIKQLTTKMRMARANGNTGLQASLSKDIGRAEVRIVKLKEQLSDNNLLGGLGSDWGSIFDGLHDSLADLSIEFPEVSELLSQTGDDTNLLAMDMSSLTGAMDGVTDASANQTKSFEQNIDIFSAFDRALKKTVTEIESDMIDRLLGTDQWAKYLQNMRDAWGYDEGFVKMIADMGMDQGYAFAAAFNAAGSDEAYVQWINQIWKDNDLYENNLNALLATFEAGTKATRDTAKAIVTQDYKTGEYMMVNGGHTNDTIVTTMLGGDVEKAQSDASAQYYAAKKQLDEDIEKINSESDKNSIAAAEANDSAADAMMSEMADSIKRAVDKYLPANAFVSIGENICKGLAAGIFKYKGQVVSDTVEFANTLITAVESAFGIASPSKVFKRIGEYCTEGLAIGLEDTAGAERSTSELGKSLLDQLQIQLARIQSLLEGDDVWTPTIRPVVDLSNVATSAEQARLMFDNSQVEAASNDLANYRLTSLPPENTLAGMSREEFTRFMNSFANAVLDGINDSSEREVNVNVYLEGDAKGVFKIVRTENQVFKRATGYSALT